MKIQTVIRMNILLLFALATISCKKGWLEAKPDKSKSVPTTFKDFQAMLDSFDFSYSSCPIGETAADGHYFTEAIWAGYAGVYYRNAYTWSKEFPQTALDVGWTLAYNKILRTNIILDGLKKIKNLSNNDQIESDNIESQAKFQRASTFFELSQNFAPAYSEATANQSLGIPLRLNSDITIPSARATVKETYTQIINDLLEIRDKLPETPPFITRASKPAVYALLARIYLSMEEYSKAFENANKCLEMKNKLIDYSKLSLSQIFIGLNEEVIFLIVDRGASSLTVNYIVEPSVLNMFDANDLRRSIFFRTSLGTLKFKGHYSNNQNNPFCGLATDELYLIRAECYARLGNLTNAMKDLNDLLKTRWAKNPDGTTKYIDQTANNETEALTKILTERKKQLILRGVRWSDLRRLNRDDRFKTTLSRTIGGNTYTIEPGSYKYTFPIPDDIIMETHMPQNPGW